MVTSKKNRLPTITISKKGVYVLRIRFRHNKKQHEMTVPGQDETAWEKAEEVKISILLDVQRKLFDETLFRYRAISGTAPRKHEVVSASQRTIDYVRLFELYLEEKGFLRPADSTDSEFTTYRMVRRWKINLYTDIRTNFLKMGYSNSTFTDSLIILKKWCDWMVDKKFLPENPVKIIKYKKRYPKKNPLREPLSDEILLQTLEALRLDQFKSPASYVHNSVYYAPLLFLLFTGCRPQEVVGPRVKYVDFANRVVMIREVLARQRSQTCSAGLVAKRQRLKLVNATSHLMLSSSTFYNFSA